MVKQEAIKNLFDNESTHVDKYDHKYFKFFQSVQNKAAVEAFAAFRTKDLPTIENTLKQLSAAITTNAYVIGLGCLIVEREKLYRKAGFASYFEYIQYLFDDADFPTSTLSDAKLSWRNISTITRS